MCKTFCLGKGDPPELNWGQASHDGSTSLNVRGARHFNQLLHQLPRAWEKTAQGEAQTAKKFVAQKLEQQKKRQKLEGGNILPSN